jgi:hypothetical protein
LLHDKSKLRKKKKTVFCCFISSTVAV